MSVVTVKEKKLPAKKKRRFKRDRMRLNKQRVLFAFDMSLNATGLNPNLNPTS